MSFITEAEFLELTTFTEIVSGVRLTVWLDTANGLLSTFTFDESREGFESALKIVATAIVESFYSSFRRENVIAANSPFKSEKFGSYSYTRLTARDSQEQTTQEETFFKSLPVSILYIIQVYLKTPDPRIITTDVFKELSPNDQGIRDWHLEPDILLDKVEEYG